MAEKEYIERGALQEIVYTRLKALEELYGAYDAYGSGYEECADRISEMPAADVVEVVRCKDCVYWDGRGWDGRCEAPSNGLIREYTNYDDFCSYGERKEQDNV